MNNKSKNTLIISIVALALVLIGVTYAYFSARITGLESASTISLTAGHMGIVYSEGDEEVTFVNIYPREEAWATKTFTLTGTNTTDQPMMYNLGLNITTNTFLDDYLTYDLSVLQSTNGTPISAKTGAPINGTGVLLFGKGTFTNADNDVHRYELKIYFKDSGEDQNDGQGSIFNAKISVTEYMQKRITIPVVVNMLVDYDIDEEACVDWFFNGYTPTQEEIEQAEIYCSGGTYYFGEYAFYIGNGELDEELIEDGIITNPVYEDITPDQIPAGFQYDDGVYTYTYGVTPSISLVETSMALTRDNEYINGWAVELTDKNSTSPVSETPYVFINDEPVVSMAGMFANTYVSSIDVSSFDTSNVTNMAGMFLGARAASINLGDIDTSNVTNMDGMFGNLSLNSLDLSSIDTSSLVSMQGMFSFSQNLDVVFRDKDLTNVTTSNLAFYYTNSADLSGVNFGVNISIVWLFSASYYNNIIDSIILDNVQINRATGDRICNRYTKANYISMRNADTSRVTSMGFWFYECGATEIDLTGIDTSNVTSMSSMFRDSSFRTLDLSSFDTSSLGSDGASAMFQNSRATVGYARTQADADIFNSVPAESGSDLTFIVKP